MDVVNLVPGARAPKGSDRVIITKISRKEYQVDGAIAAPPHAIYFAPPPFGSEQGAINAALDWAAQSGTEIVFLERRITKEARTLVAVAAG